MILKLWVIIQTQNRMYDIRSDNVAWSMKLVDTRAAALRRGYTNTRENVLNFLINYSVLMALYAQLP